MVSFARYKILIGESMKCEIFELVIVGDEIKETSLFKVPSEEEALKALKYLDKKN
ncbi:hypothetical protein NVP1170O_125 [Vibrio phage 1.170.O._10N.261.52.C3]|nr:hypothetical protein NVP1170O_125 [Vibrio phage 1.170.O._10N.261.52.C3]